MISDIGIIFEIIGFIILIPNVLDKIWVYWQKRNVLMQPHFKIPSGRDKLFPTDVIRNNFDMNERSEYWDKPRNHIKTVGVIFIIFGLLLQFSIIQI